MSGRDLNDFEPTSLLYAPQQKNQATKVIVTSVGGWVSFVHRRGHSRSDRDPHFKRGRPRDGNIQVLDFGVKVRIQLFFEMLVPERDITSIGHL